MTRERLLVTALFAALAPACASETVEMWPPAPVHFQPDPGPSAASSPTTPTDKERGLAAAYEKALGSQGFAELGPILDEEARFTFGPRNTHGRARVLLGHEDMFGAFDDRHFTLNRVWLTDSTHPLDSQALEWTMTGVHARPFRGVAATNKPVVIKGFTLLWTSDAGIITDLHVCFDEEVVMAELGGGPADLQKLPIPKMDGGALQTFERSGAPEEAANLSVVRAMLQALEDGKEADFLATFADDVEVLAMDRAEPERGKTPAREYFKTLRKSIHLLDTVVENAWGVGSFVVIEYAITGLQLAPLRRIAYAADHPLHAQFIDIAEIRDGKIARISRYTDPIAFSSQ